MTNFKRIGVKATAVLAMVAVLAASAVPAQANSTFSFGFNFGNGGYVQPLPVPQCMSDRQIIRQLRNQGYSNIQSIGERYRGFPQFYASYGGWLYTLQVNRCTGDVRILNRQRAQIFHGGPQFPNGYNYNQPSFNFGITFTPH